MIRFFRQSYALQYVILALMAIAFWLPSFIVCNVPADQSSPVAPLYNVIERLLGFSPYAKLAFAFLLMLVEALLFNAVLIENQIVGKVSTMGAFVFILLMNLTRTQVNFYPFAVAMLFILLVLRELYSVYTAQKPELGLLKTGIFVALATLCYFPSIILVLWVLIALPILKKGSLRLELIPITGILLVYFLYFSWVFLFGDFLSMMEGYGDWFAELQLSVEGFNLKSILLLSFVVAAAVLLYFGGGSANFEKTVAVRSKMTISVLLAIVSVVLLFMGSDVLLNALFFMALAIIIGYEFSYLGNTAWVELFLTIFLLMVFANHYFFKLL